MKVVVLFNLGGPDCTDSIKPFLFNLFYDPAILNLPNPWRYLFAKLISTTRYKKACEIYDHLGGASPIVQETEKQAKALERALGKGYKVLVAMRYWYPTIQEVISTLSQIQPSEVILLPLYPQFSKATTGSFFSAWDSVLAKEGLPYPIQKINCYPTHPDFIKAYRDVIEQCSVPQNARYLFSAHGLPIKNIRQGDPYEHHVQQTVEALVKSTPKIKDHIICYQSKVGPLEWLGPSTEHEIGRAARDKVPVVIVPISFVCENSETLYELDFLYKGYAAEQGLTQYFRIPTVGDNTNYIECLRDLVMASCATEACDVNCLPLGSAA